MEYSKDILLIWEGHANVKFAGSVELFEYLYKYLFKGPDKAEYDVTMDATVVDEIKESLRGRYLCATEGAWRIFGYVTYDRSPSVVCLPVHLEGDDWIEFKEGQEELALNSSISLLQRYFYRPFGPPFDTLLYNQYFEQFVVTKECPKRFQPSAVTPDASAPSQQSSLDRAPPGQQFYVSPRTRGEAPLCRLEMKFPRQKEVFFLRHILLHQPKNDFGDCRKHGGKTFATFEEALQATGRFQRSDEAHAVLDELVALRYTGAQLRFAFLVLLEQEAAPVQLFKKYERHLMKDYLNRGLSPETAWRHLISALHASWLESGNQADAWQLATPTPTEPAAVSADQPKALTRTREAVAKMVRSDKTQHAASNHILACMNKPENSFIFIGGRAGTGKSTLATHITHEVDALMKSIVNVATTGQAALELPRCGTAHSTFGIPLDGDETQACSIPLRSQRAHHLATATVIQWDEWPSAKRTDWEAVLRFFDALKLQWPKEFISKTFVCYGDFRQIPPVLPRADRRAIVSMSVRASASWALFRSFALVVKHRQARDSTYAGWIDTVGDGRTALVATRSGETSFVGLPYTERIEDEAAAIAFCFPHLNDPRHCSKSKILAARNTLVDAYNNRILRSLVETFKLPSFHRYSADTMDMDVDNCIEPHITNEFLNMQHKPGVPPHDLFLVEGALYELMRNFSVADRLMNHVPVLVKKVHENHVDVETLDGRVFPLPRICFRWQIANGTSTMTRRQYPLRPAYASTINGGQGRTLFRCALDVRHHPFSHGQLYVAVSRVCHRSDLRVLVTRDYISQAGEALTRNVVWTELLLGSVSDRSHTTEYIYIYI